MVNRKIALMSDKKFFSLILVIALIASFTACTKNEPGEIPGEQQNEAQQAEPIQPLEEKTYADRDTSALIDISDVSKDELLNVAKQAALSHIYTALEEERWRREPSQPYAPVPEIKNVKINELRYISSDRQTASKAVFLVGLKYSADFVRVDAVTPSEYDEAIALRYEKTSDGDYEWYYLGFISMDELNREFDAEAIIRYYGDKYTAALAAYFGNKVTHPEPYAYDEPNGMLRARYVPKDISYTEFEENYDNYSIMQDLITCIDAYDTIAEYSGAKMLDDLQFIEFIGINEGGYNVWKSGSVYYALEKDYEIIHYGVMCILPEAEFKNAETMVEKAVFELMDVDCALSFDPYGFLYGPYNKPEFFGFSGVYNNTQKKLDRPVKNTGDSWTELDWKNFSVVCYYDSASSKMQIIEMDCTRKTEIRTPRNIYVGDTKEKALETYSDARTDINPAIGAAGDYIWMSSNEDGTGASLTIWFENDAVSRLQVKYAER